jgi:hypothetical protein
MRFEGTHEEFAAISKAGMEKDVSILHFLGGCTVDIAGNRGIAQTKMSVSQRAPVEGVLCDVVCVGRFYGLPHGGRASHFCRRERRFKTAVRAMHVNVTGRGLSPGIGRYADQCVPSDFDLAFGLYTCRPRIAGHWPTSRY